MWYLCQNLSFQFVFPYIHGPTHSTITNSSSRLRPHPCMSLAPFLDSFFVHDLTLIPVRVLIYFFCSVFFPFYFFFPSVLYAFPNSCPRFFALISPLSSANLRPSSRYPCLSFSVFSRLAVQGTVHAMHKTFKKMYLV